MTTREIRRYNMIILTQMNSNNHIGLRMSHPWIFHTLVAMYLHTIQYTKIIYHEIPCYLSQTAEAFRGQTSLAVTTFLFWKTRIVNYPKFLKPGLEPLQTETRQLTRHIRIQCFLGEHQFQNHFLTNHHN